MINETTLNAIIDNAIREDVGDGDHSSQSCIPETAIGKAQLLVKEDGIIAGVEIAKKVFKKFDPEIKIESFINDGAEVKVGDIVFIVEGRTLDLLKAERLVLNIMQRMSGIATNTNVYIKKLEGLHTKVLDTRKTTPGLREIEKLAVKIGGGVNHRIGLYDMIMLKDNHIDFAGGIEKAVNSVHKYLKEKNKDLKIEVEVRDFDELNEVLKVGGIHRIMLDNFTPADTKKAVDLIAGKYETESSGGITLDTLRDYAECGVDYISVGALTHHIKSMDLSLKAI
ncbi:carboxylating nicotinate-nucleotide diphosphorylase [Plebeiibacterium sediminum]|uniref:Probable nicotinate-nucleotide pyrophosphorylase [carboxylating] n=1 Tax=Plebeiibacterium sediminum TaxID=2992112 RepID=A0AAE3M674_9BACT|nr:carboxylating nicotinate-nucleotide diphosphorylase [Plebeiobacterium sediminum]MCW3787360.1 carboxylating nicotinate-nucleotide diphosphorylase [Plebeiobacterium sediminum]